jgi:hypothetical protein
MAKTDVTLQFEGNAFEQFYRALKVASELYGTWDGESSFVEHFEGLGDPYFDDAVDRKAYLDAASAIEHGNMRELRVDLARVAGVKLLVDATLLRQFRAQANAEDQLPHDQTED